MYGAGRYVYDMATSLPSDWEAVVVAGGNGPLFEKLNIKSVRTLTATALVRDVALTDIQALLQLYRIFVSEKPDVVHLNSSKAGGIGALAARLAGVKSIVFTVHGFAYNETWRNPVSRALIYAASWLTALLCHRSIIIVRKELREWPFHKKSVLVHNGIAASPTVTRDEARLFFREHGVPSDALLIGTAAELHKNKAQDVLIEAVAQTSNAHLVLMGEGEERVHLETLAEKLNLKDRVHFLGYITQASMYLRGFDIFTLPSLKEGLSYAILEAGAAGLPVVATSVGGMPDIIETSKEGLLVEPKDVVGLAKALNTLIDSPTLRSQYGDALKKKIETDFSVSRMVKETITIY